MAIRLMNGPLVKKKIQRIVDRATELYPVVPRPASPGVYYSKDANRLEREDWVLQRTGMSLPYLRQIVSGKMMEPSGRVLKNLGVEIILRDLETGETEVGDFMGRCQIDHSDPSDPKLLEG